MIVNLDCQFDMIQNFPRKPISKDVGERVARKPHRNCGWHHFKDHGAGESKNEAEY